MIAGDGSSPSSHSEQVRAPAPHLQAQADRIIEHERQQNRDEKPQKGGLLMQNSCGSRITNLEKP